MSELQKSIQAKKVAHHASQWIIFIRQKFHLICAFSDDSECYFKAEDAKGTSYRGTESKTKSGKVCQKWNTKLPNDPKDIVGSKLVLINILIYRELMIFIKFQQIYFRTITHEQQLLCIAMRR